MVLAHDRRQPAAPGAVELAEARQAVAVRFGRPVFLPEQPLGDARTLELAMHHRPVGLDAIALGSRLLEQTRFERGVVEFVGHRPADPDKGETAKIIADRGAPHAERIADLAIAHPAGVLEPQ